ncbi:hypothetical protein BDW22DRAFT_1396871 [Trametopsis cervina]|nr:hypothetical protein BDW22DRAFT_1396871 [Trametopsis cervina]
MSSHGDVAGNPHTEAVNDEDTNEAAVSVPDTGDGGDGSKLKMIITLVKKCLGVKDIASMRLSLPASLLEPIPNLEYWHYLDRPDLFAAINDSADPLERMLAVLRFSFAKDLKWIHGKVCKPYNSVLGEHFRAHWDVIPVSYPSDDRTQAPIQHLYLSEAAAESSISQLPVTESSRAETASTKSGVSSIKSATSRAASSPQTPGRSTPATSPELIETELDAQISKLSLNEGEQPVELVEADDPPVPIANRPRIRVAYLTEQISHHPPVSAYVASCPSRNLEMVGIDQISAKVSGMNVRVTPGSYNKGMFIRGTGGHAEGETYQITHPTVSVNGILRGNFYLTVSDSTIITCSGTKSTKDDEQLRTIIEFKEESWLGKAHFLIEGVVHAYDPTGIAHHEWTKVKHVPKSRVVAQFHGSWKHLIKWKLVEEPDSAYRPLLDLSQLQVIPKSVRPLDEQLPTESRKLWENVTKNLLNKQYGDANKFKHAIEQKQRDDAAERKRKGTKFIPKYFAEDWEDGIPTVLPEGRAAMEEELASQAEHPLEPTKVAA